MGCFFLVEIASIHGAVLVDTFTKNMWWLALTKSAGLRMKKL